MVYDPVVAYGALQIHIIIKSQVASNCPILSRLGRPCGLVFARDDENFHQTFASVVGRIYPVLSRL